MKLSVIEPLCSKDINADLARWLTVKPIERQAVSKALDNSLKPANLSLAETISAPPKILKFEPESTKNCQLNDLKASEQLVWFKILIIENEYLGCDRLGKMLRGKDTQVIEAQDSRIGIQLAQRELPDLIICELMMPKIDGYGIKYFLQRSTLTNKIPLLFITTHIEPNDLDSETILIVDENQIKPVTRAKLCDAIADKLIRATQV